MKAWELFVGHAPSEDELVAERRERARFRAMVREVLYAHP